MASLRTIFDDLVRLETLMWNGIDARMKQECDLPLGFFKALLVIDSTPSCRVQDLASALAVTVGGASQGVDRMARAGLCVRQANPTDRRSSLVRLTPEGRRRLKCADETFDRGLSDLFGPLAAADLQVLGPALAALRGVVEPPRAQEAPEAPGHRFTGRVAPEISEKR
ncbi:MarR family winged helix-turn-helix transcriptional regulator [Sphaerisporangium dianthi]|uniref:MarR family winged helix-turn-helix transcriptional regulator n=1 Tax=Sphaerisporangium dianthi TaxID=1436120 RepID=A0ABV9CKB7_9ACTN